MIKFENFRKNTPTVVNGVFTFLGVPPLKTVKNKEQNRIPYDRRITLEERRYLYGLYEEDIARLEKLLDWDCSDWKQV